MFPFRRKIKETKHTLLSKDPIIGRGNAFITDGVEIHSDHIEIGEKLVQTFEVGFWPPAGIPGFTEELIPQHPATLVIQTVPLSNSITIKKLGRSLGLLNSSAREGRKKNIPDPELERRIQDAVNLRDAVNRGATRFFATSISLITYTPDTEKSQMSIVKGEVKRLARERSMELVSPKWEQLKVYLGAQPGGTPLLPKRLLETNSLGALYPFTDLDHYEPGGIPYGINYHTGNPLIINRWKHKNQHQVVSADSGSGKSLFVKEITGQESIMGKPVIILDPSASEEYRGTVNSLDGQYITLGIGKDVRINPLDIRPDSQKQHLDPAKVDGRPLSERISLTVPIISTMLGVQVDDTVREARITKCLQRVYEKAGFKDTWSSIFYAEKDDLYNLKWVQRDPFPTLTELTEEFKANGYHEFAESMEPFLAGGTTDMLDGQTNINTNNPVIGFGINHLIAVPGAFSRAAYAVVMDFCVGLFTTFRAVKEKLLIIDEAHNLLKNPVMAIWLVRQFNEARKAGIGVTAISTSAMHFLTEEARPIWDNASTKFFLSQPSTTLKEAATVIGIEPSLLTPAAHFPQGQILALFDNGQVYTFKSFFPPELEMIVRADAYAES